MAVPGEVGRLPHARRVTLLSRNLKDATAQYRSMARVLAQVR